MYPRAPPHNPNVDLAVPITFQTFGVSKHRQKVRQRKISCRAHNVPKVDHVRCGEESPSTEEFARLLAFVNR